jgi:hypothetical protein
MLHRTIRVHYREGTGLGQAFLCGAQKSLIGTQYLRHIFAKGRSITGTDKPKSAAKTISAGNSKTPSKNRHRRWKITLSAAQLLSAA